MQNPEAMELNWSRGRDMYCFIYVEFLSIAMEIYAPLGLMRSVELLA
jgi:hypothetical protein